MNHKEWIKLTPGEQRISVAECDKWKFQKVPGAFEFISIHPSGDTYRTPFGDIAHLPDYLGDLNVMHEAEKILYTRTDGALATFNEILEDMCTDESTFVWSATAAQRVEAFVIAMTQGEVC